MDFNYTGLHGVELNLRMFRSGWRVIIVFFTYSFHRFWKVGDTPDSLNKNSLKFIYFNATKGYLFIQ